MLYGLLLTLNALVCAALVFVVLMQRSEGGALGSGGGPTGLITTRGAGDLLTRTTWILFAIFLSLSLALTLIGAHDRSSQAILNRLKGQTVNPAAFATPAPVSTTPSAPIAPIAPVGSLNAPTSLPARVPAPVSAPVAAPVAP
ncbi:MAG TPA: preprotein translocase subunit SecG, partial [Caulobacteraceae bacterium]